MGKKLDIKPGDRFGEWTIIEIKGKDKYGATIYLCKCSCGTTRLKKTGELGVTKHCNNCNRTFPIIHPGDKFGKWTVLSEAKNKSRKGHKYYLCRCVCGKEKIVAENNLQRSKSRSCKNCSNARDPHYKEKNSKICTQCKVLKLYTEFNKLKTAFDKMKSFCKACDYKRSRSWIHNNKERATLTRRKKHLKSKFGLTPEIYESMNLSQNYRCYICLKLPRKKLYVDHCYKSGLVRKLLCNNCNSALGMVKENKTILSNMIKYINIFNKKSENQDNNQQSLL